MNRGRKLLVFLPVMVNTLLFIRPAFFVFIYFLQFLAVLDVRPYT